MLRHIASSPRIAGGGPTAQKYDTVRPDQLPRATGVERLKLRGLVSVDIQIRLQIRMASGRAPVPERLVCVCAVPIVMGVKEMDRNCFTAEVKQVRLRSLVGCLLLKSGNDN